MSAPVRSGLATRVGVPLALATASIVVTLAGLEAGLRLTSALRPPPPAAVEVPPGVRTLRGVADFASPNARGVM